MTKSSDSPEKNKRSCLIVDFAIMADHMVKLKESEKRNKLLDLARKLKENWKCNWRTRYNH